MGFVSAEGDAIDDFPILPVRPLLSKSLGHPPFGLGPGGPPFFLPARRCRPCAELQSELGDDEFKVLAINIDTGDVSKPEAFLEEIEGVSNLGL